MKFYFSVTLVAILMAQTVSAQHVNLGIKGGLNFYNIHSDNSSEYDPKTGFHLGLLGHVHLDRNFAVQPELVYSKQGAEYSIAGVNTRLKLNYINVPIMLQYMFNNGFRLEAGPQVGFLIKAESETNKTETNIKDDIKTVEFGLGFGIGYIHTPTGFGVDARYNLGLSKINENGSDKLTNRGIQLGVFYQFKHK